jgi:arylformamidase
MRVVDLSMAIAPHFRWKPEITVTGNIAQGDQFRVTRLSTTCHGFTHVDAMAHFIADAPTIEHTDLSRVLAAADPGGAEGEILLLAAQWDRRRDFTTRSFWTEAPWLTRASAEWLLERRPSAVAVDFPQDYPIRLLLDGKVVPDEEHVTHDVLLRNGVTLIEYVVNTASLTSRRVLLSAAPLKIEGADGAPARVYAIEGLTV